MRTFLLFFIASVSLFVLAPTAAAQPYQYEVRLLPRAPGATVNLPTSLNNNGLVSVLTNGAAAPFSYYTDGSQIFYIPGPAPEFGRTTALSINDLGQVFGSTFDTSGGGSPPPTPYMHSNGLSYILPIPSGANGAVPDVANSTGMAAGGTFETNLPVIWNLSAQTATTFTIPGMVTGLPNGINDTGLVVGNWEDASRRVHGFGYTTTSGPFILSELGTVDTRARAVNSAGIIVGSSVDSSGRNQAVRWDEGAISIVAGLPDASGSALLDINDSGAMLGYSAFLGNPFDAVEFLSVNGTAYSFDSMLVSTPLGFERIAGIYEINNSNMAIGSVIVNSELVPAIFVVVPSPGTALVGGFLMMMTLGRNRR